MSGLHRCGFVHPGFALSVSGLAWGRGRGISLGRERGWGGAKRCGWWWVDQQGKLG